MGRARRLAILLAALAVAAMAGALVAVGEPNRGAAPVAAPSQLREPVAAGGAQEAATPGPTVRRPRRPRLPEGNDLRAVLRRAHLTGAVDRRRWERWREDAVRARAAVRRLSGARQAELASVLTTLDGLAATGRLTASRMPLAFLTLRRNTTVWRLRTFPRPSERMTFGRDPAVFQYFPGRGVQFHGLATAGRANALAVPCLRAADRREDRALARAVRAAVRRQLGVSGAAVAVSAAVPPPSAAAVPPPSAAAVPASSAGAAPPPTAVAATSPSAAGAAPPSAGGTRSPSAAAAAPSSAGAAPPTAAAPPPSTAAPAAARPAGRCRPAALRRRLDRLMGLASIRGGFRAWEYLFAYGGGSAPWVSAMTQATAAQALARGSAALGEPRHREAALQALGAFETPPPVGVAEGQEFVMYSFSPDLRILNGFLQSVIGLHDVADLTGSQRAARLYAAGERAARGAVASYDTGAWSRYSLAGRESTLDYHRLVTGFMAGLCDRTGREAYCGGAARFDRYLREPPRIRVAVPAALREDWAATVTVSVSKVSAASVTVRDRRGTVLARSATLPRGRYRYAFVPPRPGTYAVRVAATGPEGRRAVERLRLRAKPSLARLRAAARRRAEARRERAAERRAQARRRERAAERRAEARRRDRDRGADRRDGARGRPRPRDEAVTQDGLETQMLPPAEPTPAGEPAS